MKLGKSCLTLSKPYLRSAFARMLEEVDMLEVCDNNLGLRYLPEIKCGILEPSKHLHKEW